MVSQAACGQSVAELESLVERKTASLEMHLAPEQTMIVQKAVRRKTSFALIMDQVAIVRIIDAVRTTVLNWALRLEQEGVVGEKLSFSKDEKERAGRTPHNVTNFYGNVVGPQIQQGNVEAIQIGTLSVDTAAVREFVGLLKSKLDEIELESNAREEAEADIQTIEAQVTSPNPKQSIIRDGLASLQSLLEGAAGSVAGQMLMELAKLLP